MQLQIKFHHSKNQHLYSPAFNCNCINTISFKTKQRLWAPLYSIPNKILAEFNFDFRYLNEFFRPDTEVIRSFFKKFRPFIQFFRPFIEYSRPFIKCFRPFIKNSRPYSKCFRSFIEYFHFLSVHHYCKNGCFCCRWIYHSYSAESFLHTQLFRCMYNKGRSLCRFSFINVHISFACICKRAA